MSGREVVSSLLERGFKIVTWSGAGDDKGPNEKGWHAKAAAGGYDLDDHRDGDRAGILTGIEITPGRILHDVDIDDALRAQIAIDMLPPTEFVWGRQSKRVSHCLYTTSELLPTMQFKDPVDNTMLIELRGAGLQSMCPPSIWSKDGKREPLKFMKDGSLGFVADPAKLPRRVTLAAIGMLLGKHFGRHGFGHEPRLAWAGFLLRAGVDAEDLVVMGKAISDVCSNLEVDDVRRVIESTAANLKNDKKTVKGGPALAKILGEHGKKIVSRIYEWLGHDESAVIMVGGKLSEIVDRAELALVSSSAIYQRGGLLTRAVKLDEAVGEQRDVRRRAGSTVLVPVSEAWLTEQMGRALKWMKPRATGELSPSDPAPIYARTLMARSEWSFPVMRGVVTAPTLALDGRVIETPGFDPASGLLLDFTAGSFPRVPQQPTKDDARRALVKLEHPFRKFPFVDDAAKSVALSAVLSALVRASMKNAPLHGYDAPAAGSGKSMLAEAVGLIAMGAPPPSLSQGKSPEEDEKRLVTVLFAGDPVIYIDNCERQVSGDFLCSMLTQATVQARILGLSERRVLPSTALVLASGNNLTLAGDVTRRAVICRLDAQMERPDTRVFDFDCHAEIIASRSELVIAGLTILRAYRCAGAPQRLTPMGSFEDWAWIRGALVWLDRADPADTRISILDNDPRRDELIEVMRLWEKAFGNEAVEVGQIDSAKTEEAAALRNKLIESACRQGQWNAKSIGWWLRRNKDRVVDGRAFKQRSAEDARQKLWGLESAEVRETAASAEREMPGAHVPF